MILSKKRITKALIRLRGCAGWSAPVLFANPEDRFSHVETNSDNNNSNVMLELLTRIIKIYFFLHEGLIYETKKKQLRASLEEKLINSTMCCLK